MYINLAKEEKGATYDYIRLKKVVWFSSEMWSDKSMTLLFTRATDRFSDVDHSG